MYTNDTAGAVIFMGTDEDRDIHLTPFLHGTCTVCNICNIDGIFAMEVPFVEASVREALRRVASRHPGGKVVFNMETEGSTTMATVESASETTGEAKT